MSLQTFTAEELASEEWRAIPSAPGYEASSLGRIKSAKAGRVYVFRPRLRRNGYLSVNLRIGCKTVWRSVHGLILEAFVGPRRAGMEARHFPDRTRSNNRICNLSWGTPAENGADRRLHGTNKRGAECLHAKLTDAAVALLRWLHIEHGASFHALGEWFAVSYDTISRAVNGVSWGHVSYGLPDEAAGQRTRRVH